MYYSTLSSLCKALFQSFRPGGAENLQPFLNVRCFRKARLKPSLSREVRVSVTGKVSQKACGPTGKTDSPGAQTAPACASASGPRFSAPSPWPGKQREEQRGDHGRKAHINDSKAEPADFYHLRLPGKCPQQRPGMHAKHRAPRRISARPKSTAVFRDFRRRCTSTAA